MAEATAMDSSHQQASPSPQLRAAAKGLSSSPRRYYAHYDYHDRMDDDAEATESSSSAKPFPVLLHKFLDGLSRKQQLVVSWQPHGRSFKVHNSGLFVKHFQPEYFRFSKFASIQRQLSLFGFKIMKAGPERGAYYHEYFLRSRPDLCHCIIRMKIKGTGRDPPHSPQSTDPDFSFMRPSLPAQSAQQIAPVMQDCSRSLEDTAVLKIGRRRVDDDGRADPLC